MKTLKNFIFENQEQFDNGVDSNIYLIIENAIKKLDFSKLKPWSENDKNKFDIQKENEKLFMSNFEEVNALSTKEYYETINTKNKWEQLNDSEKSKFDREEGDIIIVDNNNKPLYRIDLKISSNYLGAISMGSLCNFNMNGIYVCLCKNTKDYRIVSHNIIYKLVLDKTFQIYPPSKQSKNSYKGFNVKFDNKIYTSEYFIKGNDIKNIKK